MGKKKNKSLTERISALVNRVGEKPEPTFGYIKSALVDCLGIAEALENGGAVGDTETEIATLEAALLKSSLENSDLQAELQSLKAEVQGFREERKKQQEEERKKREMPDIQFRILKGMPSEHLGIGRSIIEISRTLSIPMDDAEVHVAQLQKAGLVGEPRPDRSGMLAWQRTVAGTTLVLAKRMAGDAAAQEEKPKSKRKYPDLSRPEALVLAILSKGETLPAEEIFERYTSAMPTTGAPVATVQTILLLLIILRDKHIMVTNEGNHPGVTPRWSIREEGVEYFTERGVF